MYYLFEFVEYMMQYNLTEPEMQYISFVRIVSRFQAHCRCVTSLAFAVLDGKLTFCIR
jgi:hypothetical protein